MRQSYLISHFASKRDIEPTPAAPTWAEISAGFSAPAIRAEKDGPLFSPAIFDPPRRKKENARELSLLVLDYDSGLSIEDGLRPWQALGLRCAYYTTHSHLRLTPDHQDAKPRYRVVIPLTGPIPANLFPALWAWAATQSGGAFDAACKDAGRIYYTPAKASEDAAYDWGEYDGASLDWRALDLSEEIARPAVAAQAARAGKWATTALNDEVLKVIQANNGTRNDALNKAAFALGQIVGGGALDAGAVSTTLERAAVGAGLSGAEARTTIKSGLDAGMKQPRSKPESVVPHRPDTPSAETTGASEPDGWWGGAPAGEAAAQQPQGQSVHSVHKPEPWDLPVPFREFDLPVFPLEALSSWQRSYVEQLAEATQTPPDLAAMQSVSAIAATVARNVEIEARQGWREPLCIFTLTVAESANRKSAVVSEITRPLERFEGDLLAEMRDTIAAAVNERKILEARLEKAQKDCAKLNGDALAKRKAEARDIAIEIENHVIPVAPRFLVDDVTSEALASKMAEQGGRIALFSAEGGIFETMAGRYSNGAPNIDVYLKGHAGDSLRVDRRQRSERIERPALTIGLAVQSDVIRGLAQKPGFRGRGLLGRFLYSLPQSRLGARKSRAKSISTEALHTYERYLIRLAAIKPAEVEDGEPEPITLRLSGEADDYLARFQDEIEPELAEGGEYATISEWAGKLCGAAVRLSGILHCADHAMSAPRIPAEVPAETFKRAVQIARYLIPHSLAAHAEMGADPLVEDARYVLRWLIRERLDDASKRDIHRGCRGRFKKITELDPVLALLEDHNYLRPVLPTRVTDKDAAETRPGRKASQIYAVNPALYLTGQNGHNGHNPVKNAEAAAGEIGSYLSGQNGHNGHNGQNTPENGNSVHSVHSVHKGKDSDSDSEPDAWEIEERAAILEFDAGMGRLEADATAARTVPGIAGGARAAGGSSTDVRRGDL